MLVTFPYCDITGVDDPRAVMCWRSPDGSWTACSQCPAVRIVSTASLSYAYIGVAAIPLDFASAPDLHQRPGPAELPRPHGGYG